MLGPAAEGSTGKQSSTVMETPRLVIRTAVAADVSLFYALWTNPQVMRYVGFPEGLPIQQSEIESKLRQQAGKGCFERWLVVADKATGLTMGECKMERPDEAGISRTDIKLLPQFWGRGYGVEVKAALVDYLFGHTDCQAIEATPNVSNIASIKMQEAVGAVRVGEAVHIFPESMQAYTVPVHHIIYRLYRSTWAERQGRRPSGRA